MTKKDKGEILFLEPLFTLCLKSDAEVSLILKAPNGPSSTDPAERSSSPSRRIKNAVSGVFSPCQTNLEALSWNSVVCPAEETFIYMCVTVTALAIMAIMCLGGCFCSACLCL